MRVFMTMLIVSLHLFALKPAFEIEASGNVLDIEVSQDGKLYVATDNSAVDIFRLEDGSKITSIEIPKIKDFMGDIIGAKIYSVDILPDSSKVLFIAQAGDGKREVYLYEDGKYRTIIDKSESLFMKKVKFVNDHQILIALLGNVLILHDINTNTNIYRKQLNQSSFSDFSLARDKKTVACSNESGKIFIVDIQSGKILKTLKGANKDNVYKVAYQKEYVSGAGQDRKGSLYKVSTGSFKTFDANFLIYSTALSPDETMVAFAFNEFNDIAIFDTASSKRLHTLKGQKSTLNAIKFINQQKLVSGSDDRFIMVWDLEK